MKVRSLVLVVSLIMSITGGTVWSRPSYAGENKSGHKKEGHHNEDDAHSSNTVTSVSSSTANAKSISKSHAEANASNALSLGITNTIGNEEQAVSSAYAPNVYPTAPCMGSSSGGASGAAFGLSLGTSWESKNCMYLETARSFEQAGYKEDAMAIRCQTDFAKKAPSCIALATKTATETKPNTTSFEPKPMVVTLNPLSR